jgi:HK97 family phage major capsid protein
MNFDDDAFRPPGTTFARAAIALMRCSLAPGELNPAAALPTALAFARRRWGENSQIVAAFKAAVAGGSLHDVAWGSTVADTRHANAEFLQLAESATAFGRLSTRRVPANVPVVTQAQGAIAYWVSPGRATPVSRLAFDRESFRPLKVGAMVVVSREQLDDPTPEAEDLLRNDLIAAARRLIDTTFLDPLNVGIADDMPASVTASSDAVLIPSTGSIEQDVQAAVAAFRGDWRSAAWIGDSLTFIQVALRTGGEGLGATLGGLGGSLLGIPAYVTSAPRTSDGGQLTLIDASSLVVVDEGVRLKASRQATVEMADDPTGDILAPAAMSRHPVSLFQSDSAALLLIRRVNWQLARAGGCVAITGVDYS